MSSSEVYGERGPGTESTVSGGRSLIFSTSAISKRGLEASMRTGRIFARRSRVSRKVLAVLVLVENGGRRVVRGGV